VPLVHKEQLAIPDQLVLKVFKEFKAPLDHKVVKATQAHREHRAFLVLPVQQDRRGRKAQALLSKAQWPMWVIYHPQATP
jgi:hypothetical protein